MKSKLLFLLIIFSFSFTSYAKAPKKPKLVVGIVLDQMRYDFLYKYADRYSENGFKRLMRDGNSCENTFINYLPSYTGPGHTCIYTGSVPALHGIASNDWIDRITGNSVYCTDDKSVQNVGGNLRTGQMSPKNLWASTITEELRLATNFKSKVIAISLKDRASILPGGHNTNGTYWMDDSLGEFMTSTYYMQKLPNWVLDFNQKKLALKYMSKDWNTIYPINTYSMSTNDDNAYEGKFYGETNTSFPHLTSKLKVADIKKTPFGNSILFDFAKEALVQEQLGMGSFTDFLAISFSSTDYIGHSYGPNSIEIEDTYLRIDAEIADFLNYLDSELGAGNYTVFLTADHGVAHNPQFLLDNKSEAGFFFGKNLATELNSFLEQKFHSKDIVKQVGENFIWFNDAVMRSSNLDREKVVQEIQSKIKLHEEIQFCVDMQNIQQAVIPDEIKQKAINGYVASRSGDLLLLLKPGWLDAYAKTGTTHGTWNPYDTHIPLLWYGWGIQKGTTYRQVNMTDIAATLASLLHIQMPNACIGKVIPEVIQ